MSYSNKSEEQMGERENRENQQDFRIWECVKRIEMKD